MYKKKKGRYAKIGKNRNKGYPMKEKTEAKF